MRTSVSSLPAFAPVRPGRLHGVGALFGAGGGAGHVSNLRFLAPIVYLARCAASTARR